MSKLKIAALFTALAVSQCASAGTSFSTSGATANQDMMVDFNLVQTKLQPVCTVTQSPVFAFGTIHASKNEAVLNSKLVISCDSTNVPLKITFDDSLSKSVYNTAQGDDVNGVALWTFRAAINHANMPKGGAAYNSTGTTIATYLDSAQSVGSNSEGYTVGGKTGGVKYLEFKTTTKVTTIGISGTLATRIPENVKSDVAKTLTLPITIEVTK